MIVVRIRARGEVDQQLGPCRLRSSRSPGPISLGLLGVPEIAVRLLQRGQVAFMAVAAWVRYF